MKLIFRTIFIAIIFMGLLLASNGCTIVPTTVTDSDGFIYEDYWDEEGYAVYLDNLFSSVSISVPETYNGKPVLAVGTYNMTVESQVKDLILPDGVLSILPSAFSNWRELESIYIPDSVSYIGEYAFSNCESLTSIIIPDNVRVLSSKVFYGCISLEVIALPEGLQTIEGHPFGKCYDLVSVLIDEDNPYFAYSDGVIYNHDMTTLVIYLPSNTDSEYSIPQGVTRIGNHAFYENETLTQVTIGNDVVEIGEFAFSRAANINSVSTGVNVHTIERFAFSEMTNLLNVDLAEGLNSIGISAFYHCERLQSISIPSSVVELGQAAFNYCSSLSEINVDGENQHYTSLNGVLYNKDMSILITYPAGKRNLIFTVPDYVDIIDVSAFESNNYINTVIISEGVTTIRNNAFAFCFLMDKAYVPISVIEIEYHAFYGTSSLTIFCEQKSRPEEWSERWKMEEQNVVWNYQSE